MGMEKADDASGSAGHALGRIGVVPYFTQVMISSMAVTEHARLEGRQLQKMTAFMDFRKGTADEEGLSFGTGKAVLAEKHGVKTIPRKLSLPWMGSSHPYRFCGVILYWDRHSSRPDVTETGSFPCTVQCSGTRNGCCWMGSRFLLYR